MSLMSYLETVWEWVPSAPWLAWDAHCLPWSSVAGQRPAHHRMNFLFSPHSFWLQFSWNLQLLLVYKLHSQLDVLCFEGGSNGHHGSSSHRSGTLHGLYGKSCFRKPFYDMDTCITPSFGLRPHKTWLRDKGCQDLEDTPESTHRGQVIQPHVSYLRSRPRPQSQRDPGEAVWNTFGNRPMEGWDDHKV